MVREPGGAEYSCRARGRIRQKSPLVVGDMVRFSPVDKNGGVDSGRAAGEGVIEDVLPRRNCLYRPPAANVDQMILVLSLSNPAPDWHLVSRLLLLAEHEGLESFLYLNKLDLVDPVAVKEVKRMLEHFNYPYNFTSAKTGKGVRQLAVQLKGRCSVFAGPSGAGKSSLLNAVEPGFSLKTGTVSHRAKRGRHTTRLVELLPLPQGGTVVDTPGFSRLDLPDIKPVELGGFFPEFSSYFRRCGYRDCVHAGEPGCAVGEAVERGEINPVRYRHYRLFLQELTGTGGRN